MGTGWFLVVVAVVLTSAPVTSLPGFCCGLVPEIAVFKLSLTHYLTIKSAFNMTVLVLTLVQANAVKLVLEPVVV